ncbi:MAG: glycosyltransferase [Clostridia bacterium]|nr:glycosyltransferase [Clostridia bacterium]
MKRILILSSNFTGHGHASIAQSLTERLDAYDDVLYEVVDGFSLVGNAGVKMSKIYGPITRNARDLWRASYEMINRHPASLNRLMTASIHDRFLKTLSRFRPDLIVTVHPFFNGSVQDILQYYRLELPMIALQADLIDIHSAWCDPRDRLTLCPTQEAYECSLRLGMPEEKLRVVGFPTRAQFTEAARNAAPRIYTPGQRLECLLMSGGEGSGNLLQYATQLLDFLDCRVSVICGRNEKMRSRLTQELKPIYGERIKIHGFLNNVHEHMMASDIVIARGSPNTLMEAVVMNVPLVITGSLPGQEADNPALMISHNLGVVCENPASVSSIVGALLRDNGRRLEEIRTSQRAYRDLDIAKNIAALLRDEAIQSDWEMPKKQLLMPIIKRNRPEREAWRARRRETE